MAGQDGMESKHVLKSSTHQFSLTILLASMFNVYQSYVVGGIGAISPADVVVLAGAISLIVNRFKDKYAQPLHFKKKANV